MLLFFLFQKGLFQGSKLNIRGGIDKWVKSCPTPTDGFL